MNDDDEITVVEDYCVVCKGKCTNLGEDIDGEHMSAEWDALAGSWVDRGVQAGDVWLFAISVVLDMARSNNVTPDELREVMETAWKKLEEFEDE